MIYLDMDGVLADFTQHTADLKIPNNPQWFEPRETWTEETWAGEKIKTEAMHSSGFWFTMPVMAGAKKLWQACLQSGQDMAVLTCRPQKDSPELVATEKFAWINANMGPLPRDRFFCVNHGEKQAFLKPGDVLIDDDTRHAEGRDPDAHFIHHRAVYKRNGGSIEVIQEPDVDATIAELKRIYA